MYSSKDEQQNQYNFGQGDPKIYCPHRHSPIFNGKFKKRHRCPRCSKQCHDNWAGQESKCVAHYINTFLPDSTTVYRGHLHMLRGSTVQGHLNARRKFLQALRKLKSRLKVRFPSLILEIRCYTHATSPDAQHYDYLAYSNVNQAELRQHIKRFWINAGGRSDVSCVVVDEGDIPKTIGYYTKTEVRYRSRFYLPANNGLEFTWGTSFFVRQSKEAIWKLLVKSWFPEQSPLEVEYAVKRNTSDNPNETLDKVLAELNAQFIPDPNRDEIDKKYIELVLKSTPVDGLSINAIAHRSGTSLFNVQRLLPTIPNVKQIENWQDGEGKVWSSSGWFIDQSNATPSQWLELSDHCRKVCDLAGLTHATLVRTLAATEFGSGVI